MTRRTSAESFARNYVRIRSDLLANSGHTKKFIARASKRPVPDKSTRHRAKDNQYRQQGVAN